MLKRTTLGEYYDVRDGTHDSPKYIKEGFPLVTSKNLKDGKIDLTKIKFISEKDYLNINKRSRVDVGDVLMAMIGTIGNPVEIIDHPQFAIKNVALFKVNEQQSSAYLKYFLSHPSTLSKMMRDAKGTTQKFVGLGYLRNFPIEIPSLPEQQRIVAKLDAAFAEIDKLITHEKERQYHHQIVISKMQNNLFEESDSLTRNVALGEVVNFENGDRGKNYPSKKHQTDEGIAFVNAGDFSLDGDIISDKLSYISEERFNLLSSGKFKLNDILFCLRGSLGKSAFNKNIEMGAIASSLVIIRAKEDIILPDYLFAFMRSNIVMKYIKETAGGTAQPNLPASAVMKYKIPLYNFEKQNKIASKFWQLRNEGLNLHKIIEQKIELLNSLKKAILKQEFLSETI